MLNEKSNAGKNKCVIIIDFYILVFFKNYLYSQKAKRVSHRHRVAYLNLFCPFHGVVTVTGDHISQPHHRCAKMGSHQCSVEVLFVSRSK